MSMGPTCSVACSIKASLSAGSDRSAGIATASPPAARTCSTVSSRLPEKRLSPGRAVRADTTTTACSMARRRAMALPIPLLAPVTSAVRPSRAPIPPPQLLRDSNQCSRLALSGRPARWSSPAARRTEDRSRALQALQGDGEIGLEDGRDVERPNVGAVAAERGHLAVSHLERAKPAGVAAGADLDGVAAGLERHLDRLVGVDGANVAPVDQHGEPAASKFDTKSLADEADTGCHLAEQATAVPVAGHRGGPCPGGPPACRRPLPGCRRALRRIALPMCIPGESLEREPTCFAPDLVPEIAPVNLWSANRPAGGFLLRVTLWGSSPVGDPPGVISCR